MENTHINLLGYRVYRTQRALSDCLENLLGRYSITPTQWNALNQLDAFGPMTQTQLAAKLQLKPPTITRSIDKLENVGLVVRRADKNDRRSNIITLQPQGKELLMRIQPEAEALAAHTAEGLDAEEREHLYSMLDIVYENALRY